MPTPPKIITKTVLILSFVSLFTDLASEMLYPIMPTYLKSIGFSILAIGILEGLAECIAGLSKAWFGSLSDNLNSRVPFVRYGYMLSAISKPLIALFTSVTWVFFARTLDRLGKGIRTGARDAILKQESTASTKSTVFGFHRSMDTIGAFLGPLLALIFLHFNPNNYKLLFLIAFGPGILSILFTFLLKEKKIEKPIKQLAKPSFRIFYTYMKTANPKFKKLSFALIVFALVNSSDVFLLLKASQSGFSAAKVVALYIFYNLVYAVLAYPAGKLADKLGNKKMLLIGFVFFISAYLLIAFTNTSIGFITVFFLYGIYAACTEGNAKAWLTYLVPSNETATAIGSFSGFQSIAALVASAVAGYIWVNFSSTATFIFTATLVLLVLLYIKKKL